MKVLIVEDVEYIAKIAQKILNGSGIQSDIALIPKEAEDLVSSTIYDAILMDFGLPDMTGLELTKVLREQGFVKPIIGLTANPGEYDIDDMKAAGLNTCLGKPLKPNDLPLLSMDASLGWVNNGRYREDGK